MSYRYPHQDDSDENGFGESLQGASQTSSSTNTGRLLGRRTAAAVDRENDDFQPAVETQRDDDDDDGDPDEEDEDVVFHGEWSCISTSIIERMLTGPQRCRTNVIR